MRRMLVLIWGIFLLGPSGVGEPFPEGELLVAASIPPLGDFARGVGGEHVRVEVLVPAGASPHTYEPTPAQMRYLSGARLLVVVGLGLEYWLPDVVAAVQNPNLEVVVTSQGIELLDENPHIWLDPLNAIIQVGHIRDALIRVDPGRRLDYEMNAAHLIGEFVELDAEIRERVSSWSGRAFIAQHPAWAYFALRYGLVQAAVIEAIPGREPSPAEIARIIEMARREGIRALFAEPQLPPRALEVIAAELGLEVIVLDPLGGVPGRESYLELMRYNLAGFEAALK